MITPVIIPVHSRENLSDSSVDFFCKTEENKTSLEQTYCDNFYAHQEVSTIIGTLFLFCLILGCVLFGAFCQKSFRWHDGSFKLVLISVVFPLVLFFILGVILVC